MGEMYMTMDTDLENAELIVIWGANPATDSPPFAMQQILRARERGARVIVIDPRSSETAELTGAEWIPIRPGTDGALALAMINVLVEEELFDEEFTDNWITIRPAISHTIRIIINGYRRINSTQDIMNRNNFIGRLTIFMLQQVNHVDLSTRRVFTEVYDDVITFSDTLCR